MKSSIRKTIIWGTWVLILVVISMCFTLQSAQSQNSLLKCFVQSSIFFSVPYIFFTTFYVIAVVIKQYYKMMYIFIIDIISSIAVVINIRYFYEGPLVARNSFLVIISVMIIKGIVLFIKRANADY